MKEVLSALLFLSMTSILAEQPIVLTPNDVQRTGPNTIDELVYSQSYNIMEIKDGYSICNYNDY